MFSILVGIFYPFAEAVFSKEGVFQQPRAIALKTPAASVNEFYKKGCQEKSFPSTGGRDSFLEIQPTDCKRPRFRPRGFALVCVPFLRGSSFAGDDANRVLKLGKRTWSWSVNHGSIGGSWPIAISGYPRRHTV
jgi:hypothetical protein